MEKMAGREDAPSSMTWHPRVCRIFDEMHLRLACGAWKGGNPYDERGV
jgi:hypothetical protein